MPQIQGSIQNIDIDTTGSGSSYKTLVCLRTSSVNTTTTVNEDETNCGKLTSVGTPGFSFDFDAVCEVSPTVSQVTYVDLLAAIKNSTLIKVRYRNPTVIGGSVGTVYYHECSAYVTDLTLNQDAAGGAYMNFSGTIQSTGTIVISA